MSRRRSDSWKPTPPEAYTWIPFDPSTPPPEGPYGILLEDRTHLAAYWNGTLWWGQGKEHHPVSYRILPDHQIKV